MKQLAEHRRSPAFGQRVPFVAGHHADVQQHHARPPLRVLQSPSDPEGAAEVVHDEVHALDSKLGARRLQKAGVGVHVVREARRRVCFTEARHVNRHGPPDGPRGVEQRRPVARRAGVAVHEHDRLARVWRTGFEHRRLRARDLQRAPQRAHRAPGDASPGAPAETAACCEDALARRDSERRACTASARGVPVRSIRAGPMLRVPNASITRAVP